MANPTLPVDALAVLAAQQEQLDALRRTVEAQQETIERLVARVGLAPAPRVARRS
ncbi:hypothetical protein EV189_0839 [Motilibacter rhizosphaerae]|uniref:Uncharacterized protein n=1 Tax=Motilibacter rhizosphaerae TaxID=598652 RepID=A0A4Q7NYV1_9ACTN|nr:hypothetical protein [Motilibacter rhizosphaerae]RZS91592.1 hypothetical protein EV189_0839 [Motilibacter rhizosphaerae]